VPRLGCAGSKGFPNLTDKDWLHGGDGGDSWSRPSLEGRIGMMPPMGAAVGSPTMSRTWPTTCCRCPAGARRRQVAAGQAEVRCLRGLPRCRRQGQSALGAPNLTDKIWLYGGSLATGHHRDHQQGSQQSDAGLQGPARPEGKIQVLAAYVWSLSNAPKTASAQK
jgi:cytochrome c oxidase cbb3-type subunit 3